MPERFRGSISQIDAQEKFHTDRVEVKEFISNLMKEYPEKFSYFQLLENVPLPHVSATTLIRTHHYGKFYVGVTREFDPHRQVVCYQVSQYRKLGHSFNDLRYRLDVKRYQGEFFYDDNWSESNIVAEQVLMLFRNFRNLYLPEKAKISLAEQKNRDGLFNL